MTRDIVAIGSLNMDVVPLGADGVVAVGAADAGGAVEHHQLPARRVTAVDTTAAGDTFTGALCESRGVYVFAADSAAIFRSACTYCSFG